MVKIVTIHGLGGTPRWRVFRELQHYLHKYKFIHIDYSDCYNSPNKINCIFSKITKNKLQEPHILIGHSLGALLSLYLQNKYTKAIVLLAPALRIKKSTEIALLAELAINKEIFIEGDRKITLTIEDLKELKRLMKNAPEIKSHFLLILAGKDWIVDNKWILRKLAQSKINNNWHSWITIIKNTGHSFKEKEKDLILIIKAYLHLLEKEHIIK